MPATEEFKRRLHTGAEGGNHYPRGAEGRCRGRKPFGYREEERDVLNRMRELRARGLGFDRIAETLNDKGLPSRDGKLWHGLVINRILSREA